MKRWQGSCIGAFLVLLVAGCSMIFIVPFGGSMIAANSTLFNKLTAYVLCPDAVDYFYNDYGFGQPTTTSPSGGTGHYTELTCTFSDGSQVIRPNEEVGIKVLGAAFTAAGICGGALVLFLMVVGAVIGGMVVKPKAQ